MTLFAISRLTAADVPLARALNVLFGQVFEDPETYAAAPPDDSWVSGLLAREGVFVLAAVENGAVIGGLTAYDLPKLEQRRSEIYIYDLAVTEDRRRQGVATALIRRLQEIAAEHGAWVIFVQGDYGDAPALALYDKLGTREEVLHFDLPVAGEGA